MREFTAVEADEPAWFIHFSEEAKGYIALNLLREAAGLCLHQVNAHPTCRARLLYAPSVVALGADCRQVATMRVALEAVATEGDHELHQLIAALLYVEGRPQDSGCPVYR